MSTTAQETESPTSPEADFNYLEGLIDRLDRCGYWGTPDDDGGDSDCVTKAPLRRAIAAAMTIRGERDQWRASQKKWQERAYAAESHIFKLMENRS